MENTFKYKKNALQIVGPTLNVNDFENNAR